MVRQFILLSLFLSFGITKIFSQNKYACFENDKNKSLKITVIFDKNEKAKFIKYQGQKDSIYIVYSKIIKSKNPGGIPAEYWEEIYLEKYNGRVTGKYSFTNAGTYQLDVTYTRKKDKKKFYFQIIDNTIDPINQPFRSTPCF